jgi:hypothetical protein
MSNNKITKKELEKMFRRDVLGEKETPFIMKIIYGIALFVVFLINLLFASLPYAIGIGILYYLLK